jgi:protein TonB
MTMAIRPEAFDSAGAHPLRHVRGLPGPLRDRVGAGLVTLAAHVLIVTAIVAGLHQANRVVTPVVVTVQLDAKPLKHDELAPPKLPVLARPAAFTAAMPQITIAPPPPGPIAASPPGPTSPAGPAVVPPPAASVPHVSNAAPTWQAQLLARLEEAKRYPEEARMHRWQGVAMLYFSMDRDGKVLSADIKQGSGYPVLDAEALALIQRAQPLPKPPAEVKGDPVQLVVPVEFFLKNRS